MKNHGSNSKKVARQMRAKARQAEFDQLSDAEKQALKASNKALYDASRVYPAMFQNKS